MPGPCWDRSADRTGSHHSRPHSPGYRHRTAPSCQYKIQCQEIRAQTAHFLITPVHTVWIIVTEKLCPANITYSVTRSEVLITFLFSTGLKRHHPVEATVSPVMRISGKIWIIICRIRIRISIKNRVYFRFKSATLNKSTGILYCTGMLYLQYKYSGNKCLLHTVHSVLDSTPDDLGGADRINSALSGTAFHGESTNVKISKIL